MKALKLFMVALMVIGMNVKAETVPKVENPSQPIPVVDYYTEKLLGWTKPDSGWVGLKFYRMLTEREVFYYFVACDPESNQYLFSYGNRYYSVGKMLVILPTAPEQLPLPPTLKGGRCDSWRTWDCPEYPLETQTNAGKTGEVPAPLWVIKPIGEVERIDKRDVRFDLSVVAVRFIRYCKVVGVSNG
jgi:hypothetical protein